MISIPSIGMSGISGTPLYKKLGYKPGFVAHVAQPPDHYDQLLADMPDGVRFVHHPDAGSLDLGHLFVVKRAELARLLPIFRALIKPAGMIWVSWPKKASKVPTDMSEDAVRDAAFPLDLVDVKVCAVDAVWSGLKVVIRKEKR